MTDFALHVLAQRTLQEVASFAMEMKIINVYPVPDHKKTSAHLRSSEFNKEGKRTAQHLLRRMVPVSRTFQDLKFDGSLQPLFIG